MKKARQIEVPEDRPLTLKEYEDFAGHAYKSSSWYATEYSRTEKQLVDKLLAKGYVRDEVEVVLRDGTIEEHDIIEETLAKLRDALLIDDARFARTFASREIQRGVGRQIISSKLFMKGCSKEDIEEALDAVYEEDEDARLDSVDKTAQRILRSSTYLRLQTDFERSSRLRRGLMSKGFTFEDISLWEESQADEED